MPDVNNALKFQRKMISVENAYLREVRSQRAQARRVLLEILQRDGVSNPGVRQMVAVIGDLSRSVNQSAAATSREIRRHVQNYTRKQLQLAQRAGLTRSADTSPVLNAGAQAARDGEESYMTSNSAWLSQLETSIRTNAARLRISGASHEEQVNRLLNERLADGRASVWVANSNLAQSEEITNVWSYGIGLLGAYMLIYNEQQLDVEFQKQAIATIDERTTDCCLRAHGQIQPIDEPFQLTGTPRYADEVQDPPFHWYCRTSEALYNPAFEEFGIPTERMVDMAHLELDARELTGKRAVIYPSHATARRAGALPSG